MMAVAAHALPAARSTARSARKDKSLPQRIFFMRCRLRTLQTLADCTLPGNLGASGGQPRYTAPARVNEKYFS
jgi:hypothetical protein